MSEKQEIYNECLRLVDEKINVAKSAMEEAQHSANQEEKSTAGDKYDTARAQSHIERDLHARRLAEAVHLKELLLTLDPTKSHDIVQSGSLVGTSQACYFISVGLGKVKAADREYFVVSPLSPIGQQLLDKKEGDSVNFNRMTFKIERVD